MRHSRKARDRGVLAGYVAGSGTQREGMQRRWNASVFMKRGLANVKAPTPELTRRLRLLTMTSRGPCDVCGVWCVVCEEGLKGLSLKC
jgi:hypothetical protein